MPQRHARYATQMPAKENNVGGVGEWQRAGMAQHSNVQPNNTRSLLHTANKVQKSMFSKPWWKVKAHTTWGQGSRIHTNTSKGKGHKASHKVQGRWHKLLPASPSLPPPSSIHSRWGPSGKINSVNAQHSRHV